MSDFDEDCYPTRENSATPSLVKLLVAVLVVLGIVFLISLFISSSMSSQVATTVNRVQQALFNNFRNVWQDHVQWTRELINAIVDGGSLVEQSAASARLLQNVPSMTAIFSKYYPAGQVAELNSLLVTHLTTAAEMVSAMKAGNNMAAADAESRLYANADNLASQYNKMNPVFYSKSEIQSMMKQHIALLKQEAVQRLNGDYLGSINTYTAISGQAKTMADYFANGIVKQFPAKFV